MRQQRMYVFGNVALDLYIVSFCEHVKVIPQKLNLPINFFETFPESSLLSTVSKKQ